MSVDIVYGENQVKLSLELSSLGIKRGKMNVFGSISTNSTIINEEVSIIKLPPISVIKLPDKCMVKLLSLSNYFKYLTYLIYDEQYDIYLNISTKLNSRNKETIIMKMVVKHSIHFHNNNYNNNNNNKIKVRCQSHGLVSRLFRLSQYHTFETIVCANNAPNNGSVINLNYLSYCIILTNSTLTGPTKMNYHLNNVSYIHQSYTHSWDNIKFFQKQSGITRPLNRRFQNYSVSLGFVESIKLYQK